ncbi:hypothetical protein KIL84_010813 [Mauremys mutica]|uniref:Uncharacterized protein n=1 Tax=Mauremys mutica TaxID=74926 RepID=A0A9D3XCE5_9SAUR|nr:hypothetical protein KIL84_010813 [Mauremys mutica]
MYKEHRIDPLELYWNPQEIIQDTINIYIFKSLTRVNLPHNLTCLKKTILRNKRIIPFYLCPLEFFELSLSPGYCICPSPQWNSFSLSPLECCESGRISWTDIFD